MAEREKRRATTFVTSRGAIINVAAPSVFIAPGVTPVDVTSPAELREELDIHSAFTWEKFLREGVDAHFNARMNALDSTQSLAKASDYWTQVTYSPTWEGYVTCPVSQRSVSLYSKRAFSYPHLSVQALIPPLSDSREDIWIGFENGSAAGNGLAAFHFGYGAGAQFVWAVMVSGMGWVIHRFVDITGLMPANYRTVFHTYDVQHQRNMAVFYVDGIAVAYGLLTPNSYFNAISGPPYGLFSIEGPISPSQTTLLEVTTSNTFWLPPLRQIQLSMSPYHFRVSDGDPLPPRVFRLYNAGTTTLWAGMAVTSAVTVTSHPFPLFGYSGKTIDFQATVAGTLFIDVLTQTNNWRVYPPNAGTAITAAVLESFPISGDEVLARLRFTPAANGTISDAEVHLR